MPGGRDRFAIVDWGDEHVLFDGLTGACHLLSAVAGDVFKLLLASGRTPLDMQQIQRALADADEAPLSEQEAEALEALLGGLRESGLVQETGA
ncbi:MAG: HPr-rel-A system PqqD family peptide chaperone [Burkholderiales bacterium]|nr:HPr-rel-A system PqqD family peptide chaperone [Burkholderiales bacterium]